MLTKTQLINSMNHLPENLTVDEIIGHVIFIDKVQKGLNDSLNNQLFSKEEAAIKLKRWLK